MHDLFNQMLKKDSPIAAELGKHSKAIADTWKAVEAAARKSGS